MKDVYPESAEVGCGRREIEDADGDAAPLDFAQQAAVGRKVLMETRVPDLPDGKRPRRCRVPPMWS